MLVKLGHCPVEYRQVALPARMDGPDNPRVRIQFLASPMNPSDLNQIEGSYPLKPTGRFPFVGGNEGLAKVIQVMDARSSDASLQEGDLVIPALPCFGMSFLKAVFLPFCTPFVP